MKHMCFYTVLSSDKEYTGRTGRYGTVSTSLIAGSVIGELESALGVGRFKSQDGEANALGDEGLGKGIEVELGNSKIGRAHV